MSRYLKLGEKSNSFYDPQTGFGLSGNEIKEITPAFLRSPRIARFLKGGGLQHAHKEEYNEYMASLKGEVITESPEKSEDELEDMTVAELKNYVTDLKWEEEDVEKAQSIKRKSELIDFIRKTEALYEQE